MDTVTLVLPVGADTGPISQDTAQFVPYREDHTNPASRLLVDVPRDVAQHMIGVGGFILAQKAMSAAEERNPPQVVHMFHPDGGSTDMFPEEDGMYIVPNGAEVDVMRSHGFKIEGEGRAPAMPATVPFADHQAALEHIDAQDRQLDALEAKITEISRDLKIARDLTDAKDGEIAKLNEALAAALKAAAPPAT